MKAADLDTPVLLLDLDALERNLARMRDLAAAAGRRYRPHAKTHKSPDVARMQAEAGAAGVCCANLGEAEVMAAAGIDDILITTPVVGESKIGRLARVRDRVRVAVVADDPGNVAMLGRAAQASGARLDVLVEADIGQGRCGVPDAAAAVRLARAIDDHPWLVFAGVQGYQGAIQMIEDPDERKAAAAVALDRLDAVCAVLGKEALPPRVRTGGGTGTTPFDLGRGSLTEIQPGSYVFMDTRYGAVGWPDGGRPPFEQALHLLATVISRPVPGRAVVDAGLKALSGDHGPPRPAGVAGVAFEFGGDEHGILRGGGATPLAVGDKLRLVPSHCDTTVNLHDQYMIVRDGAVVDAWAVAARGRSR